MHFSSPNLFWKILPSEIDTSVNHQSCCTCWSSLKIWPKKREMRRRPHHHRRAGNRFPASRALANTRVARRRTKKILARRLPRKWVGVRIIDTYIHARVFHLRTNIRVRFYFAVAFFVVIVGVRPRSTRSAWLEWVTKNKSLGWHWYFTSVRVASTRQFFNLFF